MKIGGCEPKADAKESAEKAFDRTRDQAWARAVDSWAWELRGDGNSVKAGLCQRCGHTITFTDATAVYSGFSEREAVPDAGRRYAACNCGVVHPDAPDGEVGCGANGLISRNSDQEED